MQIEQPLGVCGVKEDTERLAEIAASVCDGNCKVLDMGTGTGYVAIHLARLGFKADASDISLKAVQTAKKNAEKNKVKINVYHSDLFEKIKDKYDLIIFNPPISDSNKTIKSMLRRIPLIETFAPFTCFLFKDFRRKLIKRFFLKSRECLNKNGRILIGLSEKEKIHEFMDLKIIKKYEHKKMRQHFLLLGLHPHHCNNDKSNEEH